MMERILNQFKKLLLEKTTSNVNDFDIKIYQLAGSPEYVRAKARSKFSNEEWDLRIAKFDLTTYGSIVSVVISERVVYNINALSMINRQYDLQLSESDFEQERVKGDTFILRAKRDSPFFTGELKVRVYVPEEDLVGFLDGCTHVSKKAPDQELTRYLFRHLTFSYIYDDLAALVVGKGVEPKVLEMLTHLAVNWVVSDAPTENNLRGVVVVSNGEVSTRFSQGTRLLKLGLNTKLCTNISGVLEIYY